MSEQLSLFPEPETKDGACAIPVVDAHAGKSSAKGEPIAGYASVVVDIPARAIADAFAYAVPAHLADEVELGCTVLVAFGRQMALGYVVALADALADIPGSLRLRVLTLPVRWRFG